MITILNFGCGGVADSHTASLLACAVGASGLLSYVGPGAGLSMLSALFAVACVILLALFGPLLYPIRWLRRWLRPRPDGMAVMASGQGSTAKTLESASPRAPGETRVETM
jgi:hypothetical protein